MNIESIKQPKDFPSIMRVLVEIPSNSSVKYEVDKDTGLLMVDRLMYAAMVYPFNYGFVPNTLAKDGDPLDVLVLTGSDIQAGSMIDVRPVGVLEMEDESGLDDKIIAVPVKNVDPFAAHIEDIDDVDEATKEKITHFFERYKDLEKEKWVKVKGYSDTKKALEIIKDSVK